MNWDDLAIPAIEILTPIITALLSWLAYRLAAWLKAKTQNEQLAALSLKLGDALATLVTEAEQTVVASIKRSKSPGSDGGVRLTPDEAVGIRLAVVAKLRKQLGEAGLREIESVLGIPRETIPTFIESKIERAVFDLKNSK